MYLEFIEIRASFRGSTFATFLVSHYFLEDTKLAKVNNYR